ncbi:hypothetical protein [Ralstonia thomasii]|uniref:Uncharacterized protein n=1 Tax=Ralstonia thomasii TaxID=3058596 RepID=A0ABM9JWU9_9RALS|nr:hypothetical protein [Ralstonia sp. LMG 18095]CAJ0807028.1 hypothetical protein LMG18095_04539 [Ralstonia sp. LMG 18095]
MILTINNKQMAFGLDWRVLLSKGKPDALAKKSKANLLWADPAGQYVGMLPPGESGAKKGGSVYAGAQLVLRATSDPNIAYVAEIPGTDRYLVVCIHQRRPRRDFDRVGLTAADVRELLDQFTQLCAGQAMVVYGNAHLEELQSLPLEELVEYAEGHSIMRRPKVLFGPLHAVALVVVIGGVVFGVRAYLDWQARKNLERAALNAPTADEKYAQSIAVLSQQPVMLARDVGAYLGWVRSLPVSVGGWGIRAVDCQLANAEKLTCDVKLERNFAQATNASFLAAAPEAWRRSVIFDADQKTAHVTDQVPITATTIKAVLAMAPVGADVPSQFTPKLQGMAVLGTEPKLEALAPYGVPADVQVAEIKSIYREGVWKTQLPLRSVPRISTLPTYAYIRSLGLTLDKSPKSTPDESFAVVKIVGAILTK